jgi:hypothetical protein
MGLETFNKLKRLFKKEKKKPKAKGNYAEVDGVMVPKAWLPKNRKKLEKQGYVVLKKKETKKYHIPHFRTFKRGMAAILMFFNFFSSQFLFFGEGASPFMGAVFFFNAYVCADYLWQTRKEPELFKRVTKVEEEVES